jgi:hypothetical protein
MFKRIARRIKVPDMDRALYPGSFESTYPIANRDYYCLINQLCYRPEMFDRGVILAVKRLHNTWYAAQIRYYGEYQIGLE